MGTPALPILVEEEEEIMEAEPASTTPTRRGSKRKARDSGAVIDVDMEEASPSPKKGKKKVRTSEPMEESSKEEEAPRKMSRKEQKKSLGAQLAVSEDDEVS